MQYGHPATGLGRTNRNDCDKDRLTRHMCEACPDRHEKALGHLADPFRASADTSNDTWHPPFLGATLVLATVMSHPANALAQRLQEIIPDSETPVFRGKHDSTIG